MDVKVGPTIRKAREEAGLTQGELAERADLSRVYVTLLENGKKMPSIEVFGRVAGALGIKASRLLARAEKAARE